MTRKSTILPVLYAVLFTAAFILVGWRELNPLAFPDLEAYRIGFESGWYYFTTLNLGPLEFLLREGVWVRLFDALYALLDDMDATFTTISIAAVFMMGIFVARRTQSPWYLLFFVNPAFIQMTMEQIRSGLAAGIFWTAVALDSKPLKIALLVLAAAIHTAFFLFGALYLLFLFVENKAFTERVVRNAILMVALVALLALLVTLFRETAMQSIGDTRAYLAIDFSSGILLAFAWTSFFVTYLVLRSEDRVSFEPLLFGFGAMAALGSAFAGQYGARYVAIVIPAIAVMCWQVDARYRAIFALQYAVFTAMYFRYWLI